MRYLLDANGVITLMDRERGQRLLRRVAMRPAVAVVTSAIVAHELHYGVAGSARVAENRRRLDDVFADLEVLPFTREDAEVAGAVRAALRRAGTPIGPYDVLIAGQALSRGLVLVKNNGREFTRVQGLAVEDWS